VCDTTTDGSVSKLNSVCDTTTDGSVRKLNCVCVCVCVCDTTTFGSVSKLNSVCETLQQIALLVKCYKWRRQWRILLLFVGCDVYVLLNDAVKW